MYLELLLRPGESFARIRDGAAFSWLFVLVGFGNVEYQRTYEFVLRHDTAWTSEAVIGIGLFCLSSLVIPSVLYALFCGGTLHAAARILNGQVGLRTSIRVTGAALFWPGILSISAIVLDAALRYASGGLASAALIPLALSVASGVWSIYNVAYALRVRHMFSWRRALAACASSILVFAAFLWAFWHFLKSDAAAALL